MDKDMDDFVGDYWEWLREFYRRQVVNDCIRAQNIIYAVELAREAKLKKIRKEWEESDDE